MRLDQHPSAAALAPGATTDLSDDLRHAFLAAKVGAVQQGIGIDDAHQLQRREVVPFGEHLSAQDDAGLFLLRNRKQRLHGLGATHGIAVNAMYGALESVAQEILGLLRAQSLREQGGSGAGGTVHGQGLARGAVVAAQGPAAQVHRETRIAVLAAGDPATGMALQGRRITAAVEEQQRLTLLDLHRLLNGPEQLVAEPGVHGLTAQVERVQRRQGAAATSLQAVMRIASQARIAQGFERRRGAAQHDGAALNLSSLHGDVSRRVAKTVLLFVGAVVLFVDHQQPRSRQRGKDGGARADHNAGGAGSGRFPGAQAPALGQAGMQDRDGRGKASLEAGQSLWRKADFWNEHQGLAPRIEAAGNKLKVHFGFSASGNALQQMALELAQAHGFDCRALLRGQRRPGFAPAPSGVALRP